MRERERGFDALPGERRISRELERVTDRGSLSLSLSLEKLSVVAADRRRLWKLWTLETLEFFILPLVAGPPHLLRDARAALVGAPRTALHSHARFAAYASRWALLLLEMGHFLKMGSFEVVNLNV